jgi:hypothetical protein
MQVLEEYQELLEAWDDFCFRQQQWSDDENSRTDTGTGCRWFLRLFLLLPVDWVIFPCGSFIFHPASSFIPILPRDLQWKITIASGSFHNIIYAHVLPSPLFFEPIWTWSQGSNVVFFDCFQSPVFEEAKIARVVFHCPIFNSLHCLLHRILVVVVWFRDESLVLVYVFQLDCFMCQTNLPNYLLLSHYCCGMDLLLVFLLFMGVSFFSFTKRLVGDGVGNWYRYRNRTIEGGNLLCGFGGVLFIWWCIFRCGIIGDGTIFTQHMPVFFPFHCFGEIFLLNITRYI